MAYRTRRTTRTKRKPAKRATSEATKAVQTSYARAVMNPKTGPLVGVPQFVPINSHCVRARCISTYTTSGGEASIFFNPMAMVANDLVGFGGTSADGGAVKVFATSGAVTDSAPALSVQSNVDYTLSDFTNGEMKARVVGAMIRVCNVTADQYRDGVFTALHEMHHHAIEDWTLADMSKQQNAVITPAMGGKWVSLHYRPTRQEEIEEWITTPGVLGNDILAQNGDANDGNYNDKDPGYMRINWKGGANSQTFQIEAYAIIEYVGERVTTLARPQHTGASGAHPRQIRHVSDLMQKIEQGANTLNAKPDERSGAPPNASLVEETRYHEVWRDGDKTYVWWKGTAEPGVAKTKDAAREWAEDAWLLLGGRVGAIERDVKSVREKYGEESATVHHAGYSRGGALAKSFGGVGHGSAEFTGRYGAKAGAVERRASVNDPFHRWLVPTANVYFRRYRRRRKARYGF